MAATAARARARGALVRFRRLPCLLIAAWASAAAAADCAADRIDAHAQVTKVYDGDTVRLRGGERLRLIGLDTPELGRDGGDDQPLAAAARDALRRRLADPTLQLRYDSERRDAHGRGLAHAFFKDGGSVSAWLLEQGLATLLIVPPDVWNAECYAAAEHRARAARRGLWALPAYRPVAATELTPPARGYRVVTGRVLRVDAAPEALWLRLEGRFAVRIDNDDLGYFAGVPLRELVRREVAVRGRIYPVDDELHLKLRHPANLEWTP